jgi:hypothetical protein
MRLVNYRCDYCDRPSSTKLRAYTLHQHHFCDRRCYARYRQEVLVPSQQNSWKGGISPREASRRWRDRHRQKAQAMAKSRRAREVNAPGSHTTKDWDQIKQRYRYCCARRDETCRGPLTKDHIVPLVMSGSNNPDNLQPLCKSHNVRKSRRVQLDFRHAPSIRPDKPTTRAGSGRDKPNYKEES